MGNFCPWVIFSHQWTMDQNTLKNILLKMNQITVSEISKSLPDNSDTNLILATSFKKLNLWLNLNIETKNLK